MSRRLPERTVRRRITSARDHLAPVQFRRLEALVAALDANSQLLVTQAVQVIADATGSGAAQPADFDNVYRSISAALLDAGIDLRFVLDRPGMSPEIRSCWFEGEEDLAAELAVMSERGTRDLGVAHAVQPEVAEVKTVIRVYISASDRTNKAYNTFGERLGPRLSVSAEPSFELACSWNVPVGENAEEWRLARLAEADVAVALVDVSYLQPGQRELARVRLHPHVCFHFGNVPCNAHYRGLDPGTFVRQGKSYLDTVESGRDGYIDDLVASIRRMVTALPAAKGKPSRPLDLEKLAARAAGRRLDKVTYVDARIAETSWDGPPDAQVRPLSEPKDAVERLIAWATDTSGTAPPHCALLGDTGMGKTTTAKLFTRRLLEHRRIDRSVPVPIYLDLRDLPIGGKERGTTGDALQPGASLRVILQLLLNAVADAEQQGISAEEVLQTIRDGNCAVIFDGLDEVLVHLSPADGQRFTRTLWQAIETVDQSRAATTTRSKLLLSCRTHYFRSIREEATHFTGQNRQGPQRNQYLTLLMLPFGTDQIRQYLSANLPNIDTDAFLQIIGGVHNLTELAERPYTLKLISQQAEFLEKAKLEGRTVRSVDIYGEVTRQWLERDAGKHSLEPSHKLLLMEHLATELWRSGRSGWTVDDLDNWLVEFIAERPQLAAHYRGRRDDPTLWKEDLRTATFVARNDDDTFAFAHTSLREYFVACHLAHSLSDAKSDVDLAAEAWRLRVPSLETLDFLGELMDGASDEERSARLRMLREFRSTYRPGTSELAFAYALRAAEQQHAAQALAGSVLDGADLSDWVIGNNSGHRLNLAAISLAGARLIGARLENADLLGAVLTSCDLSRATIIDCDLTDAAFDDAILIGTILRHCEAPGLPTKNCHPYRTQLLHCNIGSVVDDTAEEWLAAICRVDGQNLRLPKHPPKAAWAIFSGHRGRIDDVAYSPDGAYLATVDDYSVCLWDSGTREIRHRLLRRRPELLSPRLQGDTSLAFSADGQRLFIAGGFGEFQACDLGTGEAVNVPEVVLAMRSARAYSLVGTTLAIAGPDRSVQIFELGSEVHLRAVLENVGAIQRIVSNRDGTHLAVVGNFRRLRVWEIATRQVVFALGLQPETADIALSPDRSRLAIASGDTVRLWDTLVSTRRATLRRLSGPEPMLTIKSHSSFDGFRGVRFSADGTQFVTIDAAFVETWDSKTGENLATFSRRSYALPTAVAFSVDGSALATADADGSIRIMEPVVGDLGSLPSYLSRIADMTFNSDGTELSLVGQGNGITIRHSETGKIAQTINGSSIGLNCLAYSPDDSRLATGDRAGRICIWDRASGNLEFTLSGHATSVRTIAYSPDGSRLATVSYDDTVQIWDAGTGAALHAFSPDSDYSVRIAPHHSPVGAAAFSSDGLYFTTFANLPRVVEVWYLTCGNPMRKSVLLLQNGVTSIACSPDGARLAISSGWDKTDILDTSTGTKVQTLEGECAAAFSPNSAQIATANRDHKIHIWDVVTGELVQTLTGHTDDVSFILYHPDGTRLVSSSWDGTMRSWNIDETGRATFRIDCLPGGNYAVTELPSERLIEVSPDAWRWLGWQTQIAGRISRLPAETYGPLPVREDDNQTST